MRIPNCNLVRTSNVTCLSRWICLLPLLLSLPLLAQDYALRWYTIDGGGEMMSVGGDFELAGTIAQPDTGVMTGGGFELRGGFWAALAPLPCPWDLDSDGTVGAADLLSLLVNWGPCANCIDCPADFDANCTVGASDLLALLVNWGPCS